MSTIAIVVIVLAVAGGITYLLMKKGKIADANNNNIPDAIEEKVEEVKEVVKETKIRAKRVAEEAKDVVAAVKEVGKQASQVVKAVKSTEARKGRKPAAKK
jgi:coenzyme F420-reducing hydrogenase delta subunit